jgi:hypothetical protein
MPIWLADVDRCQVIDVTGDDLNRQLPQRRLTEADAGGPAPVHRAELARPA